MPIQITTFLVPKYGAKWFLLEDIYLRGGFRTVKDHLERDSLHQSTRKPLMLVATQDDNAIWQLQADLITWVEFKTTTDYYPFYTHEQLTASSIWRVEHNKLSRFFTYTLFDEDGFQVVPNEVIIEDQNVIRFEFLVSIKGHVVISFAKGNAL